MRTIHLLLMFLGAVSAQTPSTPTISDSVVVVDSLPSEALAGASAVPTDTLRSDSGAVVDPSAEPDSTVAPTEPDIRTTKSGSVGATVTVKGQARHKRKEISTSTLRREDVKAVAATMQDPLRALSTLPGVSAASDLSVRPVVRGGDLTETGVQLDGVPLLMPYHFGSIFSVFHREGIEDFQMYSGVAPAQSEGMLSGMVVARSRPAPIDSAFGGVDMSMLRGSAWMGVPLVKDRVGLWLSAQSLWYDWVVKRGMDLGVLFGVAEKKDVEEYKSYVTLPTTWDVQGGVSAQWNRDWNLDLGGFVAGDRFKILEQIDICLEGGKEVLCRYGGYWDYASQRWIDTASKNQQHKQVFDTSATVDLFNWLGRARLTWSPDRDVSVEAVAALQNVDWNARFPGNRELECDSLGKNCVVVRRYDSALFDWVRHRADLEVTVRRRWSESHETSLGAGIGRRSEKARTKLVRPLAQMILGTTGNPMEFLGIYNEKEILVVGDGDNSFLDIEDMMELDFSYDSSMSGFEPNVWTEHRWDPDPTTRVRAGLRVSSDAEGGIDIPNPRLQVQRQVTENDLLGIGFALHTQSELPFEWKMAAIKPLESEKAWLGIVEWEHVFAPGWRSTVSGWGKLYRDLASPNMIAVGAFDSARYRSELNSWLWSNYRDLGIPDSVIHPTTSYQWDRSLSNQENQRRSDSMIAARLDKAISLVPEQVRLQAAEAIQEHALAYESTGEGWAVGLEASLRYQPTAGWNGWASAEWSMSRRKDRPEGIWYPFGLERPWKLSWVNSFRIDKKWELSLRYAALGGNPYTPSNLWQQVFDDDHESDTTLWIGRRNSANLAPYQRLDLRLQRETRMFGFPSTIYYEIWNAFNDPNFLLRDNATGQFRWIQWNVPVPTIFLGLEVRF